MKRNLMFLLMLYLVQPFVTLAQSDVQLFVGGQSIKGTDSFDYQTDDRGRGCYIYSNYIFITLPTKSNGVDINVYKRTDVVIQNGKISMQNVCQISGTNPYTIIKNSENNQFFSGLVGDKVFIDSGTGTNWRGLKIIDLKSKKSVYSVKVREVGELQDKRFLTYIDYSTAKRSLEQCPKATEWHKQGLRVGWVQQARLDLQTLKKTTVGKVYCIEVQ